MDQMGERGASIALSMPSSCEPGTPREKLQTQMPTEIVQVTQLSKAGWIHTRPGGTKDCHLIPRGQLLNPAVRGQRELKLNVAKSYTISR